MWRTASVLVIAAIALAALGMGSPGLGGPPPSGTSTIAVFDWVVDATPAGVHDEGRGPYTDQVDGVTCYVNAATDDFLLDIGSYAVPRAARNARSMYFDLRHPVDPSQVAYGSGEYWPQDVHLNVRNVGTVGGTGTTFGGFLLKLNGVTHRLRYGFDATDGTSLLQVTRTSATAWEIKTAPGDVAKLWKETKSGLQDLGNFHVPLKITLTAK
jgi:hypothetical protein